ncbi:MAG: MmgE/PrpD family protein [Rubrivivax sp.]|nr:MmgE/PrpD family protein [Rubrivivax sp.]
MDEVRAPAAPSLSEQLAAFWARARYDDLPPDVVRAAKRFVLDTVAAGVAGARTDVVHAVLHAARAASGAGGVMLWGRRETLAPAAAAMVNGTAAHALELDDFGGCGHSGAVVIPAAAALATRARCSGRDFILAVVAGYDVASRVLDGSGGYRPHNERGWHSTGTCGSFGAAAAAAKLLGASERAFTHALGIAGTFTGGTWAFLDDGAMVKRFHPGKAAETGVGAALLAEAGLSGPAHILDARWGGFYPTYAPDVSTPQAAVFDLGRAFHILRSGIKPYACCRTIHSCLDAVLELVPAGTSHDVARMIVHGNAQTQLQFSRTEVRSLLQAQFSMPYCLAVAAESGRATLDQFEPLRTADAEVQRLMAVTEIRADRVLGAKDYPSLEVVYRDGTRRLLDVPLAKGAPEVPISDDELRQKAMDLLGPVLGAERADALVAGIAALERGADTASLLRLAVPEASG